MKYITILILALFVSSNLVGLAAVTGSAYSHTDQSTLSTIEPEDVAESWWIDWFRDRNNNRIDDLIEEGLSDGSTSFPIFIDYDRRPADDVIELLDALDVDISYRAKYIDTICAVDVPYTTIKTISKLQGVVMVEIQPEIISHLDSSAPGLRSRGSSVYSPFSAIDTGFSGQDIVIAIMDTGVDDTVHQSLRGKFVGGADVAGVVRLNNTNPNDDLGHGTHVAGIALGDGGTGGDYIGLAPNASLVDVKISLGIGGDIMEGIEWVIDNKEAKNISIVSLSAGTSSGSDGTDTLSREANAAVDAGLIFLASSGNDGSKLINAPAAADKVLAVGATDDKNTITRTDDVIAGFSNYGPRPDDKDSDPMDELKPEIVAPGVNIFAPKHNSVDSYIAFSGTSMSCPAAAGVVALMLEANAALTPSEVRQILTETAEARGTATLPSVHEKYNARFGFGIVDAYGAVKRSEALATSELEGPEVAGRGQANAFKFNFEYTRTEFTTNEDTVTASIYVPGSWSKPEDISSKNDLGSSGISSEVATLEPKKVGGEWKVEVIIDYSGTITEPYVIKPEISFTSEAPGNAPNDARYDLRGVLSLNGLEGEPAEFDVGVEPMQENIDLVVTTSDITFSNDNPVFLENVVIKVTVNNTGTSDARSVLVNFTDGPPLTGREIGDDVINNVPGGGSGEAQVTWQATPGVHTIYVSVDPMNVIEETNENNNVAPSTPLVVQGGVNNPPKADLEAYPRDAGLGQPVTFDGSGSFDTDGEVVKYNFDFGDGLNSSWVDQETFQHIYTDIGNYTATLVVQDNGGQQSVPDTFIVRVTEKGTYVEQFYFYMNYNLLDPKPLSHSFNYVGVESSTSSSVIPQWKYVGNWSTKDELAPMTLTDTAAFFAWVQNTGNTPVNVMQVEFTLMVNGENVTSAESGIVTNITPGGDPEPIRVEDVALSGRRIKANDIVTVSVRSMVNSDSVVFVFGGMAYDTRVDFHHTIPDLEPPTAAAGADTSVYVDQEVAFDGSGSTDPDGSIEKYEWDFEGDGVFDYESTEGTATFTYTQPGVYDARLQVTDDDGLTDYDERKITVQSGAPNQPPTVEIQSPKDNSDVKETITITGYAKDEMVITMVQVAYNFGEWHNTEKEAVGSGTYSWSIDWDTTAYASGFNSITARAFDGEMYSSEMTITVNIANEELPPEIIDEDVRPFSVPADDTTPLKITVEVYYEGELDDLDVTVDTREIGGVKSQKMYDDGSHGDKKIGDGEYAILTTVPNSVDPGDKILVIIVEDRKGNSDTAELIMEVTSSGTTGPNHAPKIETQIADPTIADNDGETMVTFRVTVSDEDGLSDIQAVTIDLSPIGGAENTLMMDDGKTHGDAIAGDGIYQFTTQVATTTVPGPKELQVLVTDSSNEIAVSYINLIVEQFVPEQPLETAEQILNFFTNPTIIFLIGIIIVIIIVGALVRVIGKGKKRLPAQQGQTFQTHQLQMEEDIEPVQLELND